MHFRLLGPITACSATGTTLAIAHRERVVLAALLLDADRVVPHDRLVEAVWATRPPRTAQDQLYSCVSRLRRLFREAATAEITTTTDGCRIGIDPPSLDIHVFEDHLATAYAARARRSWNEAVRAFRAAERLWRGPALDGVDSDLLRDAAASFDQRRLDALEDRYDLESQHTHDDDTVADLTALVARHPLRERLHGALIRALYLAGRRAEALAAYEHARVRLARHGREPGDDLRTVHELVRRREPAATLARDQPSGGRPALPVPAQLPPDITCFAGREDQLHRLHELLLDTRAAAATTIVGVAGAGKSALAVHWGHQVRDRFPGGQLYLNLRGFDPTGAPMSTAEAVRTLLVGLRVPPQQLPAGVPAQIGLYRSLLADRRVLILLDNARDSDQARPLLPVAGGCVALVTSRNYLSDLVAADGARPLLLDVPTAAEARRMLEGRLGAGRVAAEPAAVDEIIHRCGRLPVGLAVVAACAATRPDLPLRAVAAALPGSGDAPNDLARLPTDVRAVLSWAYHTLGAGAARLFRLLGLHPAGDITVPAAASLAGASGAGAASLLTELAGHGLVTEHAPGRYAPHDLMRALAAELSNAAGSDDAGAEARRRVLDHYLHTAHAAVQCLFPHRTPVALAPVAPGTIVDPPAADADARTWLHAERVTLVAAVTDAARAGFHAHARRLARVLFPFFDAQGFWSDATATLQVALAAAGGAGDAELGGIHWYLGRSLGRQRRAEDARWHLRRAVETFTRTGDRFTLADIHVALGTLYEQDGEYLETLQHARVALRFAEAAANRGCRARALQQICWSLAHVGEPAAALSYGERALAGFREIDDPAGEANAWDAVGFAHHRAGDHRRAIASYRRALDRYGRRDDRHDRHDDRHDRRDDRYGRAETLDHLGDAYLAVNGIGYAVAAWRSALAILDDLADPRAGGVRRKLSGTAARRGTAQGC